MNKPVRTTTPSGEEIVILRAKDYDLLIGAAEDARDVAIADRAWSELEAGDNETLSAEEMRELLKAPHPVSFWRQRRKMTQA